jgi:hypothetical protein
MWDITQRPLAIYILVKLQLRLHMASELQVASEDPPINSEFEAGGGEALQPPAPSGPQTAPTATADGVVGVHLQHYVLSS